MIIISLFRRSPRPRYCTMLEDKPKTSLGSVLGYTPCSTTVNRPFCGWLPQGNACQCRAFRTALPQTTPLGEEIRPRIWNGVKRNDKTAKQSRTLSFWWSIPANQSSKTTWTCEARRRLPCGFVDRMAAPQHEILLLPPLAWTPTPAQDLLYFEDSWLSVLCRDQGRKAILNRM